MKLNSGLVLWLLIGGLITAATATVLSYPAATHACQQDCQSPGGGN